MATNNKRAALKLVSSRPTKRFGHRGYLDAPRLYTVREHYGAPRPRGHRAFLNIGRASK